MTGRACELHPQTLCPPLTADGAAEGQLGAPSGHGHSSRVHTEGAACACACAQAPVPVPKHLCTFPAGPTPCDWWGMCLSSESGCVPGSGDQTPEQQHTSQSRCLQNRTCSRASCSCPSPSLLVTVTIPLPSDFRGSATLGCPPSPKQ